MSAKHPVIAVTGSSGAGTTTTSLAFRKIFAQLNLHAAEVEGDSFHRYTRPEMDMLRQVIYISSKKTKRYSEMYISMPWLLVEHIIHYLSMIKKKELRLSCLISVF